MLLHRQTRSAPRRPRPRVVISSLLSTLLLLVVGATAAVAKPAPFDEGRTPTGGSSGGGAGTGFDWTPWLWAALAVVVLIGLASIATSVLSHRHRAAHV